MDDLALWAAYYEIEPWGEERADLRSAIVAQVVYSLLKPPRAPAYDIERFMAVPPPATSRKASGGTRRMSGDMAATYLRSLAEAMVANRGRK